MGRASRNKRERQNHRRWSTTNPWSGRRETFTVQISDAALREWERDRVMLRSQGYPDRPPVMDTANFRAWQLHDGPAEAADITLGSDRSASVVGIWRAANDQTSLKGILGRRPDGELILDVQVADGSGPRRCTLRQIPSILVAAEYLRRVAAALGLPEPTFIDNDAIRAELADSQGVNARA